MFRRVLSAILDRLRTTLAGVGPRALLAGLAAFGLYSAGLLGVGVLVGDWASDNEIKTAVVDWLEARTAGRGAARAAVSQTVEWRSFHTGLHDLELAAITLAPFETFGSGGAIEEIEGSIVFASPLGGLGYLTPDLELRTIDLRVPLNVEDLRASETYHRPGFIDAQFRVLDLLAVPRGEGRYELYASRHRFGDECFDVVVERAALVVDADGIRAASPEWEPVFVAGPCAPPKDVGSVFEGSEAGGRMVLRGPRTMLLSLGDLEFNGVDDERAFAQDPTADFGKIHEIDLDTLESRVVSTGHRNPQGLLVARDGTVWETEHGPEGGDEINVIREGRNYGWPYATYGVHYSYGQGRRDWPVAEVQGRHDGFERPAFAFVPSIGISNLVQPDPREFPLWEDHLLVASLNTGRALFLVRIEDGERGVYAEPILIEQTLRDLIVLDDGRIAVLTDAGELILVRNAEHAGEGAPLAVRASDQVAELLNTQPAAAPAGRSAGELLFVNRCVTCHSLSGAPGAGPPLDGLLGRRIGSAEGFGYSPALSEAEGDWSEGLLTRFLNDPQATFHGTTMPPPGLSRRDVGALVGFLKSM